MSASLFLLCSLSASTWWNFSDKGIKEKIRNSIDKPLFILLYSHYCPHCVGLPEGFSRYNEGIGNRSDIFLSMIDCASESGCGFFAIHGTPTMYLVLGPKRRYWPISPERGPEGWNRWINERIGPNLRQIYNQSQLQEAIREPSEGGSAFVLEVPSADDPLVAQINDTSRTFRVYNDTFVYIVNSSLHKPSLRAFYSEHCSREYSGGSLRSFIDANKFGVFHRYDKDEYSDLLRGKKAAIFVVEEQLSDSQRFAINEMTRGHCGDIIIGWASLKDDNYILKLAGTNSSQVPFLHSIGFNSGSRKFYKQRLLDVWRSRFMNDSSKSTLLSSFLRILSLRGSDGRFVTVFYGIIAIICSVARTNLRTKKVQKSA